MRRRMLFNKTEYPKVHNTTYLYYLGDECIDITGGWSAFNFSTAVSRAFVNPIKNADSFTLNLGSIATGKSGLTTANKINIRYYVLFGQYNKSFSVRDTGYKYLATYNQKVLSGEQPFVNTNTSGIGLKIKQLQSSYDSLYFAFVLSGYAYRDENYTSNVAFIAKQDDISGLSAYGSDIATIILNATSLLQDHNAVVYMLNQCTGDFMWSALADSTFVSTLRTSPYYSEIMADEDWNKALVLLEV